MRTFLLGTLALLSFAFAGQAQDELIGHAAGRYTVRVYHGDSYRGIYRGVAKVQYSEAHILRIDLHPSEDFYRGFDCEIVAEAAGSKGTLRQLVTKPSSGTPVSARDVPLAKEAAARALRLNDEPDASETLRNLRLAYTIDRSDNAEIELVYVIRGKDGRVFTVRGHIELPGGPH